MKIVHLRSQSSPNLGNHDSSIIKAIHEQDNIAPSNVPTHNLQLVTTDKRRVSISYRMIDH